MAESVQQKLLDGAFALNVSAVKKHLKAGASVNKGDKNGCDALYNAISCLGQGNDPEVQASQKAIVELLISAGADMNKRYKYLSGWSPVMLAASSGHVGALEILLKHGADIELADDYGFTPLMRAALSGQASAAKMLLDAGANARKKNENNETALDLAKQGEEEDSGQTGADYKLTIKLLKQAK